MANEKDGATENGDAVLLCSTRVYPFDTHKKRPARVGFNLLIRLKRSSHPNETFLSLNNTRIDNAYIMQYT